MRLVYLPSTRGDLLWLRHYYARVFPAGAAAARTRMLAMERLILDNPHLGRPTHRAGVRRLPVVSRPRLRRAALQLVVRYPEKLSVPLATEIVVGAGATGFVGGLDAVLDYSFRARLPDIEVPALIVWGRNDILIPVEDAYEFEQLIGANARAVVFDDTGHLPQLERPSRFNALLGAFLAGRELAGLGA